MNKYFMEMKTESFKYKISTKRSQVTNIKQFEQKGFFFSFIPIRPQLWYEKDALFNKYTESPNANIFTEVHRI